jgi:hypothetical protein
LVHAHGDAACLQGVEHEVARLRVQPAGHHPAARDHRHVETEVAQHSATSTPMKPAPTIRALVTSPRRARSTSVVAARSDLKF